MNRTRIASATSALVTGIATAVLALQDDGTSMIVPLTDPGRPARLVVEVLAGSITVKGGTGKEIVVQASTRGDDDGGNDDSDHDDDDRSDREEEGDCSAGLRRIPNVSTGLEVIEEDNTVYVETSSHRRAVDLEIHVPVRTSLKLGTVNDGDIHVEGVDGEIEVENTNGGVTLMNVSGSVVAHALNEDVTVDLVRVESGKAMSFSSLNGNLDVTFPANLQAELRLKADNGEIYTDFDVDMRKARANSSSSSSGSSDTPKSKKKGFYAQEGYGMQGNVNGGGPTIRFETFNGDIYIRKRK